MTPPLGGTPDAIANGAGKLANVAIAVHGISPGVSANAGKASGAAGDPTVTAALDRFGAAFTRYTLDLAAQLSAAGTLALHGSQDLATAGGTAPAGGGPQRPR
jgi:hypothetical protein